MFSVSKKGLGLSKVQKITLRVWKPQYCFVWLGEIDVRMHLVKHNNSGALDLSWLDELLTEFRMLFKTLGQPVMVVFSPVPQSEIKVIDSEFPAYGDFKSRIRVQDQFIRELEKSILLANFPIKFLEISSFLKDESGQLNPNFSEDNCHLNFEGFEAIKGLWAELDGPFLI
jgi:hypothetical protein